MTEYTAEERKHARKVLGFIDDDGKHIPLKNRTMVSLLETISFIQAQHKDKITAMQGAEKALLERLKAHRKAKAEANKRADKAVAAMRDMLDRFEKEIRND